MTRSTSIGRRTLLKAALASSGGVALAVSSGLEAPAIAAPRISRTLAKDLAVPWGVAFLPSGNALVGERDSGDVHVVRRGGGRTRVGNLDVFSQLSAGGEGGLLGLALHPEFRSNRWVYAYLSTRNDNRIVRARFVDGVLGQRHRVLAGIPMSGHHNGGGLTFGPDGLLYASTGDAEDSSRAQSRSSLGGKVLRLTPQGDMPQGNPFGNYTWSMGHRNVEGITFDSRGTLWASEFGEKQADELNRIVPGANYGWPQVEGGDGRGGYRDPLAQWSPTSTCSPAGVAAANGRAWLGALRGQCVFSVRLRGPNAGTIGKHFAGRFGRIRQVAKALDGSLWITTSNRDGRGSPGADDDKVIRVALG
ncbi:MAG: PQQ-dependent sugar dehydrogenase [Sporichthyaceae bacterium]|nr:PQQ-dependent sugar dehydrogenase [Sporichthyaceae bacterium]